MKIKTTAIFKELQGAIGETTIQIRKKTLALVQKAIPYSIIPRARSILQKALWEQYGYWLWQWGKLSPAEKQTYEDIGAAEQISGWNAYIKINLSCGRYNIAAYGLNVYCE